MPILESHHDSITWASGGISGKCSVNGQGCEAPLINKTGTTTTIDQAVAAIRAVIMGEMMPLLFRESAFPNMDIALKKSIRPRSSPAIKKSMPIIHSQGMNAPQVNNSTPPLKSAESVIGVRFVIGFI